MSYQSDSSPRNAPNIKPKAGLEPLSPEKQRRLDENELIIGQGIKAFVAVGLALIEIREDKLYEGKYKTFEDYCKTRWGMTRQRGYQLIEAAEVAEEMSTIGLHLDNERQARAMAMVPQHLRADVAEAVRSSGLEPTEQNVTKAVNALLDRKRQEAKEREALGLADKDDEEKDETAADAAASETEAPQEEAPEAKPKKESTRATTLRNAADRFKKERMDLSRGLEYLRLSLKNLRKVDLRELKTKKAREAAREAFEQADAVFATVLGLVTLAEAG